LWGSNLLKKQIFSLEISYSEQNGYLKILIGGIFPRKIFYRGGGFPGKLLEINTQLVFSAKSKK
jgi:hypothetical protein